MDGKQFQRRVRSIVLLQCVILFAFAWVLYDLQYVHGADYLEQYMSAVDWGIVGERIEEAVKW